MGSSLFSKIDLRAIVRNHWETLVDNANGKRSWFDVAVFYGGPAIVVTLMLFLRVHVNDNTLNVITNALAILAGLLFNLLVLLQSLGWPRDDHAVHQKAHRLAKEIYANIAYAILVSLAALIPLVITSNYPLAQYPRDIAAAVAIYFVVHFVLTMCMVLKRMHVVLHDVFESQA